MPFQTTLVATMGGQPQVVTFMLDLLLAENKPVDQVVIVYLEGGQRYQRALRLLSGEFAEDCYNGRPCHLRLSPVRINDRVLSDAYEPAQVNAIRARFDALLSELKAQNQAVHLGLSGGRRIMALMALPAAERHLTPTDKIWHIHTPDDLTQQARDGTILHAPPGSSVCLIEVPFVPWAAYFPGLAPLLERPPQALGHSTYGWMDPDDRRRCEAVWNSLSTRLREVLRAYAEGLERKEIAARLGIKVSTIDSHREKIRASCELAWSRDGLVFNERYWQEKFLAFINGLDIV